MTSKRKLSVATKKRLFLDALAAGATVSDAARSGGTQRCTAYRWRKADKAFAAAWADASAEGVDALLGEAQRRAMGIKKPIMHNGRPILDENGDPLYSLDYSDTLLMFLLKSRDPERFDDRVRAAKIERKWAKRDAKNGDQGDGLKPLAEVLELLAGAASAKAALAN